MRAYIVSGAAEVPKKPEDAAKFEGDRWMLR